MCANDQMIDQYRLTATCISQIYIYIHICIYILSVSPLVFFVASVRVKGHAVPLTLHNKIL